MPTVPHDKLRAAAAALLEASGSSAEEAGIVAAHLVEANLKGHDSHGVGMIPHYMRHLKEDKLALNAHLKIVRDDGPFLLGDGGRGHGQVVANELVAAALARVKSTGIVAAGLFNSHHIGRVGAYGERIAEAGCVSLHFVNVAGHGPIVAPFGGSDARFGTNPLCMAVPATEKRPAIVLDFATSKVALGKVRVAKNKGQRMAPGLLLTPRGKPTTDPGVMYREPRGAVTTFGDHKGYGLALMAEALGAALIGGLTIAPHHPRVTGITNNMLVVAIDPARFGDRTRFGREVDALVAYYKASPPAKKSSPAVVAGEPELRRKAEREKRGIAIDPVTWGELRAAAEQVGLGGERFETLARRG